jgi:YidC/Oxa1 family membrane protein insertase
MTPIFASTLGQIFQPLFDAMAWLIAFFYALIPNYAVAIALLTVTVMAITAPLTIKSTRSMLAMQRLQPEMKKLQAKYKGDKQALNEEMMKLYREHNVNPVGGCLPVVIQFPVFIGLYDVIRGLTHTVTVHGHEVARPYYVNPHTQLYQALAATPGEMKAFGINLADSLFSPQSSWVGHIPYAALVAVAIVLQYLTMRQMNRRNPAAAQANPQMQAMQKFMPLIFAVIYIRIAAGVNIYFIVSALCRIGLQAWVFHSETKRQAALAAGEEVRSARRGGGTADAPAPRRRGFMERLADMQQRAIEQQNARNAALGQGVTEDRPSTPKSGPAASTPPRQGTKPSTRPTNGSSGSGNGASPAAKGGAGTTKGGGGSTSSASNGGGTSPIRGGNGASRSGGTARSGDSSGSGSTSDEEADGAKAAHPRSKAKKARKAR